MQLLLERVCYACKGSSNGRMSLDGGDTDFNVDDEVVAALALGTTAVGACYVLTVNTMSLVILNGMTGQTDRPSRPTAPRNMELPKEMAASHFKLSRQSQMEMPDRSASPPAAKATVLGGSTPIQSPPAKKSKAANMSSESLTSTRASSKPRSHDHSGHM